MKHKHIFTYSMLFMAHMIAMLWPFSTDANRGQDAMALAQVAVSESGFDGQGDQAAIWHVLKYRARRRGVSLERMAHIYSDRVFDRAHSGSRKWLAYLRYDGAEPEHWDRRIPWSHFRGRWLNILNRAKEFVKGNVTDPCAGYAHHWGMSHPDSIDYIRATRAGWYRVDCGQTLNAFWWVPPRNHTDAILPSMNLSQAMVSPQ